MSAALQNMLNEYPEEAKSLARLVAVETAERVLRTMAPKALKSEWITKEVAQELMQCSYTTLNNRVNEGYIRKNNHGRHGQKYYNRADIEAFVSGQPNKYQP